MSVGHLGIYGSLQTKFCVPVPTLQSPNHSLFLVILGKFPVKTVSTRLPLGYYLTFNKLAHKLSELTSNLKDCFTKRAWLKHLISLKPKPPCDLGSINLFQANEDIFLLPSSTSHQYFLTNFVRSSVTEKGGLKTLITYVGIA
jgi:hypothetical protein